MTFKKTSISCGAGGDGNEGCPVRYVDIYDYRSLIFDVAVWSGLGFALLSLPSIAKNQSGLRT